ncbi:MAG: hypothetical protein ABIQ02_14920 [Saprospiraceae bacterium]
MKQRLGTTILFILTILFTIGIPSCEPDYAVYRNIEKVEIWDPLTRKILEIPALTSSDSIFLVISTQVDYFSLQHNQTSGTMNEAWATSPERSVMANEVRDIRIFCDHLIYGISSGQNLAPILMFDNYGFEKWPLAMLLDELPHKGDQVHIDVKIFVFFNTKPDPGVYTFTVEMEDNNGHIFTSSSPALEWL